MDASPATTRKIRRATLRSGRRDHRDELDIEARRVKCECAQCLKTGQTWPAGFVGLLTVFRQKHGRLLVPVHRFACSWQCALDRWQGNYLRADDEDVRKITAVDSPEMEDLADKFGWAEAESRGVRAAEMKLPPDGEGNDDPVAVRALERIMRGRSYDLLIRRRSRLEILDAVLGELRHADPGLAIGDVKNRLRHVLALMRSSAREAAGVSTRRAA